MYENVYGFSCVENQVLAQLKSSGMDISALYRVLDIDFESLFYEMMVKGTKPEYFSLIPKIQDVLKNAGVISLERKEAAGIDEIIMTLNEGIFKVFIKINPDFVRKRLYARGLREDHYVYIEKTGDNFTLYNDLPETTATVSFSELCDIYTGSYFAFKRLRNLTENDILSIQSKMQTDCSRVKFPVQAEFLNEISDIGLKFRNLMWIYKILVYRFTECNSKKIAKKKIRESRDYAENIFALSEYLHLKKSNDIAKYCELINEVYKSDRILRNSLEVLQHVY